MTWVKRQQFHEKWLKCRKEQTCRPERPIFRCNVSPMRRYHTWALLSGVCGKEWGVDLLSNSVTWELLGCRAVKRNKKPFAAGFVIWDRSCLRSKNKVKSCVRTARLCAGSKPWMQSQRTQSQSQGCLSSQSDHSSSLLSPIWALSQPAAEKKVALSDWIWRRDAVKGNKQTSIQERAINPFRAAGPSGNERHVLIIEDADMIFMCNCRLCPTCWSCGD